MDATQLTLFLSSRSPVATKPAQYASETATVTGDAFATLLRQKQAERAQAETIRQSETSRTAEDRPSRRQADAAAVHASSADASVSNSKAVTNDHPVKAPRHLPHNGQSTDASAENKGAVTKQGKIASQQASRKSTTTDSNADQIVADQADQSR